MGIPLPNVSPCQILACLLLPSQLQAPINASLCYIAALAAHKLAAPSPLLFDHSGLQLLLAVSSWSLASSDMLMPTKDCILIAVPLTFDLSD